MTQMGVSYPFISSATVRNWNKLDTDTGERLTARANKCRSKKKITPESYILSSDITSLLTEVSDCGEHLKNIMFSLCVRKLNALKNDNPNIGRFMEEYKACTFIPFIVQDSLFLDSDRDWLGYVYQSQIPEGERNMNGQYYTGYDVVNTMLDGLNLEENQTFLDPCCGGGAFLLNVRGGTLSQLYGIDSDDIAVMICKANLIAKYHDDFSYPKIFQSDFLMNQSIFDNDLISDVKFDYIYTNPPWGVSRLQSYESEIIHSGERSSMFIVKAVEKLKTGGVMNFLLPSSILKIKVHSDIRNYILNNMAIEEISLYKERFNGVFTDFFSLKLSKTPISGKQSYMVNKYGNHICVTMPVGRNVSEISLNTSLDDFIIRRMEEKRNDDLSHSVWALGIVTGDNKNKLKKEPFDKSEAIFTGKEIIPYTLKSPSNYIVYDRSALQQCAKDSIYRCPEKLVYKFISKSLCFAYDGSGSLFLNSANILIPDIEGMSIKTVMAFLNSELFTFFYSRKFTDIKILKGNLQTIPFPKITSEQNDRMTGLVDEILLYNSDVKDRIDRDIYDIYGFGEEIINYIKNSRNGNIAE